MYRDILAVQVASQSSVVDDYIEDGYTFSGDDTRYRLNGTTISVKMLVTHRTDGQAHYAIMGGVPVIY